MTVKRMRCSDVQVGNVLVELFGIDRKVIDLTPWQHPTYPELRGRVAKYVPGPTNTITLIDGEWIDVRLPD